MSRIRTALKSLFSRSSTTQINELEAASLLWPEEPLDRSTAERGGYYAATPGEVLNSRYSVLRKLGWGQHSNVWLARDNSEGRHVALKILSAHATSVQGKVSHELELLKEIRSARLNSRHEGGSRVLQFHDDFSFESHHGRHLCLVTEVLGPTLDSVKRIFKNNQIPLPMVKDITRQMLSGLDFLHDDCGIIHTDIKPDNISVAIEDVEAALAQEPQRELHAEPDLQKFPIKPVLSQRILISSGQILPPREIRLKLTDFGTAARRDGFHAPIIQPYALRAPEVILGCEWDTSADIWNLGCLVFEFLTGRWLFVPRAGDTWTAEDYHLAAMPKVAGEPFAIDFLRRGQHFHKYFSDEGHPRIRTDHRDLYHALCNYQVLGEDELQATVAFLRLMLQLDPSNRATARQLLQHEWIAS